MTRGPRLWLTLLTGTILAVLAGQAAAGEPIVVRIYDVARLPAPTLARAVSQADRVFRHAGVGAEWVVCREASADTDGRCVPPPSSLDLLVRLLDDTFPGGTAVCGTAIKSQDRDTGQVVSIFLRCVQRVADRFVVPDDTALAYCLAHELGHQLLPTAGHAVGGIMSASIDPVDWRRAVAGRLWFSDEEAQGLRGGVAARQQRAAAAGASLAHAAACVDQHGGSCR